MIFILQLTSASPDSLPPEYFVEPGHSAKGFYSIHINTFYDLEQNTYTHALLQPVHEKDEFRAFVISLTGTRFFPGQKMFILGTGDTVLIIT